MSSKNEDAEKTSNPFDPFDMIDALDKSTNANRENTAPGTRDSSLVPISQSNDSAPPDIEEGRARVRSCNWPKPVRYDYSVYNVKPDDEEHNTELLGEKSLVEPKNEPDWLHNAAKYEWDDEYGEIGPEVPELEKQLFHGEHTMRRGNDIQALEFEVKLEGPTPVRPVRQVSLNSFNVRLSSFILMPWFIKTYSSNIPVSTQLC